MIVISFQIQPPQRMCVLATLLAPVAEAIRVVVGATMEKGRA